MAAHEGRDSDGWPTPTAAALELEELERSKQRKEERAQRKAAYMEAVRQGIRLNAEVEVYSQKFKQWLAGRVVSMDGDEVKVEYGNREKVRFQSLFHRLC
jgi:hypothetical protein